MKPGLTSTEERLQDAAGLDAWEDERILEALIGGQERAIAAVRAALPGIARAASAIAERIGAGGKLIYAGAGTSIRIGVQDGAELPATFGMREEQLAYLIAGGRAAIFESFAAAEDDASAGASAAEICASGDALIAVAASGSTPYTVAAARRARERGCLVVGVVNNAGSALGAAADIEIRLDSGPEVIAGSTRMGAGTAQKAALNLLSTLTHVKLGAVYDGMMVNVAAGNRKLAKRAAAIVMRISGVNEAQAAKALEDSKGAVKPAILICAGAKGLEKSLDMLKDAKGNLRAALARLAGAQNASNQRAGKG